MKKFLLIVLSGLPLLYSCEKSPEYKVCYYDTGDDTLQIYNDVLGELIVQHFNRMYLGSKGDDLWEKYGGVPLDSNEYESFDRDVIMLHNEMFNDTTQFSTICLRTDIEFNFREYSQYLEMDSLTGWASDTSLDLQKSVDQLSAPQKLQPEDFHLCVAKVVPYQKWLKGCDMGYISFSKPVTDKEMKKGLLYYEYVCDVKCQHGAILMIEKIDRRWSIKDRIELWIE